MLSCGKSDKKVASERFATAGVLLQKGDTTSALRELDSVQALFPKIFEISEKARNLGNKVNSELLYRKQQQLKIANEHVADLEALFNKEKTEFDYFARYVYKDQKSKQRLNHSYIEIHLNERGDLYISSNYFGNEWLEHTAIRVYDNIFQAKTDTVSLNDPNNHRSDFMNMHWEKVSYKNGKDNGVIQFIADNSDRNLKAAFLGKRMYFIVLETLDKQAVKSALQLSNAIKKRTQVQNEIKELKSSLN
jgi:hypothetical protein